MGWKADLEKPEEKGIPGVSWGFRILERAHCNDPAVVSASRVHAVVLNYLELGRS